MHIKTYISSSATRRPTGRANITHVVDQECHKDGWLLDRLTIKVQIIVETKFNSTFFLHALLDYITLYRLKTEMGMG